MTLENILNMAKVGVAAALVAGSMYPKDANALDWIGRSDPASQCYVRADRISANAFEDRVMAPIGLENCATLESYTDDTSDSTPLVLALEAGEVYDFATTRTQNTEAPANNYAVNGLPPFCDFDSQFGVTTCDAPLGTSGEFLVEYNVVPEDGLSGSVNPLFVLYDFGTVGALNVEGLDFEGDDEVTSWPYHGTWADADNNGVIDQPWAVYENKANPAPAWVRTDKSSITLSTRGTYELPGYAELIGDRIEMNPADETAGQSGTLELMITDNDTGNTRPLDVPYQVVPKEPVMVGLAYDGQNGLIDNPVDGPFFEYDVEIPCTVDNDEKFVVTQHYDPDMQYQIINNPPGKVVINQSTGAILSNFDCGTDIGWEFNVSVRAQNNSASSLYQTGTIVVTNGVTQQSLPPKKPNYR